MSQKGEARLRLRAGIGLGVDDVGRHHAGELATEAVAVGGDVLGPDRVEVAFVDRHVVVRVGLDEAVAGEVLADAAHAGIGHPRTQRLGERGNGLRVAMEGAVADGAAAAVVEIEHRREAEVDAMRQQFGGKHEAGSAGGIERREVVLRPQRAEAAHGGQAGEAVGAEALYPAPFMIDRDDQRRVAQCPDLGGERAQLVGAGVVAREQDHTADQRIEQALALRVGERSAGDVDHDGAARTVDRLAHGVRSLDSDALDQRERHDVVFLVADAEVGAQRVRLHVRGEAIVVTVLGLAECIVGDGNGVQRGGHGHTGAERLAERLLGGEALGEEACRVAVRTPCLDL